MLGHARERPGSALFSLQLPLLLCLRLGLKLVVIGLDEDLIIRSFTQALLGALAERGRILPPNICRLRELSNICRSLQ